MGRRRWSALAVLAVVVAGGLLPRTDFLERMELRTHDARFARRGPRASSAGIVIVTLDDATVRAWDDQPMAFWGGRYAALVRQARRWGAGWIGFDIVPATYAEESLHTMVARIFERVRGSGPAARLTDADLDALLSAPEMLPDTRFREAVQAERGRVILADVADVEGRGSLLIDELKGLLDEEYIGFLDAPLQLDNAVRTASLFHRRDSAIQPGLAALLAARARGRNPGSADDLRGLIGAAPSNAELETFWINYTGKRFPLLSAARLAAGRLSEAERRALRGAVVLVGATYGGSGDVHRMPGAGGSSDEVAGVAIHAHTLATLLDGRALHRMTRSVEGLLTAGLILLFALPLVLLPFWWGLGVMIAAGSLWWAAAIQTFATGDTLLPVVGPLVGIAALFLVSHAVRSLEEALARRQVERVFGRYVSPQIRNFLLENPRHLDLGGFESEASVLFFDVRDWTGFAEKRSPMQVMEALNGLFCVVVPVLDRRGGLLYEFLGDGFMAVFGAPFPLDNHARAATEAAIEIVRGVRRLNASRAEEGLPPWRVGCGIHSGPLVCGNLGVEDRSEFTVIGDTVNLAARLEELNKALDSEVVVSQATYERLGGLLPAQGPFPCKIAGRQDPICVYLVPVA